MWKGCMSMNALVAAATMTYIPNKKRCSRQGRRMVYLDECHAVSGTSCLIELVLRLHWYACENMNQMRCKMESPLNRSSSMTTSKVKFSMLSSSSGITSAQASNHQAQNPKPQSSNLRAQTCTQRPARAAWRTPVRGPDDDDDGDGGGSE